MDEAAISAYITGTFAGIETVTATGTTFFFYGQERMLPLATIVTNDDNDNASDLNRPFVFRLNIGIGKTTYHSLFGAHAAEPYTGERGYDFTALDQLMPHPVYSQMNWVCILNPSAATFETVVRPLLAEAYELAARKHTRRAARGRDHNAEDAASAETAEI